MSLAVIITIGFCHWFADFITQTEKLAVNKNTSYYYLAIHSLVYTITFGVLVAFGLGFLTTIPYHTIAFWVVINGFLHLVVDYFTTVSQKLTVSAKHYLTIVGLDHFLHISLLLITYVLFV